LSQILLKFGPQMGDNRTGVITHPHYFVPSQSIAHPLNGINVAPHSVTAAQIRSLKRC